MGFKLPCGHKFVPTDQVLIEEYLLKKAAGKALPVEGLVEECDVYNEAGLQEVFARVRLHEEEEETGQLYFFTRLRKKSLKGSRIDRRVGSGTWKGLDKGKPIVDGHGRLIGTKLCFDYVNKSSSESRQWDMKEWRLDGISLNHELKFKEYVICQVKMKVKGRKRQRIEQLVHEEADLLIEDYGDWNTFISAEKEDQNPGEQSVSEEVQSINQEAAIPVDGYVEWGKLPSLEDEQNLGEAQSASKFAEEDGEDWIYSNICFDDILADLDS